MELRLGERRRVAVQVGRSEWARLHNFRLRYGPGWSWAHDFEWDTWGFHLTVLGVAVQGVLYTRGRQLAFRDVDFNDRD